MPTSFPYSTGELVSAASINSLQLLDEVEVTSGTQASLELTVPVEGPVRVMGVLRSDATAVRDTLLVAINNFSDTNAYRMTRVSWTADAATPTVTFQARNANWQLGAVATAANASSGNELGSVEAVLFNMGARKRIQWQGGQLPTTTAADATHVMGNGRVIDISPITTIQLTLQTGAFASGTRFWLVRG